mmetsp:Transcript_17543/g.37048  ORF Transcript_17543/g.37048 Transcript_17543/m.37048 type:complete len:213 (+) Transcript_17543:2862-3500(+)
MFHTRTSDGSARKPANENVSDAGTSIFLIPGSQMLWRRSLRYSVLNGPPYDRNAAQMAQSPMSCCVRASKVLALESHRTRSPPNPPTSLCARSNFASSSADSFMSLSFKFTLSSYFCFRPIILSVITCRSSCAAFSCARFLAKVSMAPFNFAFLGATFLAILPYTPIAMTHLHNDFAAPDCFPTVSGSNSGLEVHLETLVSIASFRFASLSY